MRFARGDCCLSLLLRFLKIQKLKKQENNAWRLWGRTQGELVIKGMRQHQQKHWELSTENCDPSPVSWELWQKDMRHNRPWVSFTLCGVYDKCGTKYFNYFNRFMAVGRCQIACTRMKYAGRKVRPTEPKDNGSFETKDIRPISV